MLLDGSLDLCSLRACTDIGQEPCLVLDRPLSCRPTVRRATNGGEEARRKERMGGGPRTGAVIEAGAIGTTGRGGGRCQKQIDQPATLNAGTHAWVQEVRTRPLLYARRVCPLYFCSGSRSCCCCCCCFSASCCSSSNCCRCSSACAFLSSYASKSSSPLSATAGGGRTGQPGGNERGSP